MNARRRPNILVVTHLFPTDERPVQGPWVAEQVDALRAHADVSVLCCSQYTRDGQDERPSGARVTFRDTSTPLGHGRLGLAASSLRYRRALTKHLREHPETELVHAHFGFPDAVIATRAAHRARIPTVITLHGDDGLSLLPRRDPLGASVRGAVSSAATTICVSEAMAEVARRAAAPGADIRVVRNGYDSSLFSLSTGPRDLGVLFVGLLVPVKNLHVLIDAYSRVRSTLGLPLTIVGSGPMDAELRHAVEGMGLSDSVRFVGQQPRTEVAALMKRAHCLVLPSRSEGWPLVVLESLAVGTPVVASRVGGIPEIMAAPEAGELVEPGNPAVLAKAIVRVAGREHDREAVRAASAAEPWTVQAERIAEVYADVLRSSSR